MDMEVIGLSGILHLCMHNCCLKMRESERRKIGLFEIELLAASVKAEQVFSKLSF